MTASTIAHRWNLHLKTLSSVDIGVFAGYMVVLFGIGVWFTRRQKNLKTYLLADQNVHWIIVAISVLAALFSGNTYLGAPAETFFHNLVYLWVMVSFVIATPITTLVFLPFFRGLNLITAYEYLEVRFDRKLRLLASALFLSRVTLYIATVIYAPALAVTSITDLPLWQTVVVTGTTATIYTSLGGMKAVIWTDSLQFLVLCGGIVLIVILPHHRAGWPVRCLATRGCGWQDTLFQFRSRSDGTHNLLVRNPGRHSP